MRDHLVKRDFALKSGETPASHTLVIQRGRDGAGKTQCVNPPPVQFPGMNGLHGLDVVPHATGGSMNDDGVAHDPCLVRPLPHLLDRRDQIGQQHPDGDLKPAAIKTAQYDTHEPAAKKREWRDNRSRQQNTKQGLKLE
ncbi:MAG TPA: hypothetical protein DIT13_12990 [Verrucomicrobiales bacterium]|nr:hypothetical protein [Verrucomicrobiales bacterium]